MSARFSHDIPSLAGLAFAALVALLLTAGTAAAQTGTVSGQVIDQDGQPFAFADVFLEAEAGPWQESALSDDEGRFRFSPVPVGTYKLYAYAQGFSSTRFGGIVVTPNASPRFELTLSTAETLVEEVEIDARIANLVDTRRTENSASLGGDFIEAIPLQNKRIQDIVFLFAGVTRNGSSDSADISVSGGQANQIGYRLNGLSINDPVDGGAILDISTAAIASFKLISGGFQAEYGEQSTGIVEIITKSGTNEVTFSYDVTFRDTDYGASSIDGLDEVQAFWDDTLNGIVEDEPVLNRIELVEGFRLLGIDPISTRNDDNNPPPRARVRHTLSTGGPIVRDKAFFFISIEQVRDDFGNAFAGGTNYSDQTLLNTKLDWQATEDHKIELTANLDVSDSTGFTSFTATPSVDQTATGGAWTVSAKDTWILNDTTFLETKGQYVHNYSTVRPTDPRDVAGTQFDVFVPPGGLINYTIGDPIQNTDETIDTLRVESTLAKAIGDRNQHDFKTGLLYEWTSFSTFQEIGTQVDDFRVADDRGALAAALGGVRSRFIGNVQDAGPPLEADEATWKVGFFVQDGWQMTEQFRLDLGLRAEYQEFVGELFLAPRIGFSLDPIGDGSTRFAGSWGIFYDNLFVNALRFQSTPNRFFDQLLFANRTVAADRGAFNETSITELYKEGLSTSFRQQNDEDALAILFPLIQDRFVLDEDLTAPTNEEWYLSIERRLPANVRFQASYAEAKRSHQLRQVPETVAVPQDVGDRTIRDILLTTTGTGRYRQWSVELQKPFAANWQVNMSYVQARNTGPLFTAAGDVIDPTDVSTENGILGNDRTHVVKMQGTAKLPWKVDMSADFTWQTGQPVTAEIVTSSGAVLRPFGRNTLRNPSSRTLNIGLKRPFTTADGKIRVQGEVQIFNVLNELNVFSSIGRFDVPPGTADPQSFPPLRPDVQPFGIDIGRSLEFGLSVSF